MGRASLALMGHGGLVALHRRSRFVLRKLFLTRDKGRGT